MGWHDQNKIAGRLNLPRGWHVNQIRFETIGANTLNYERFLKTKSSISPMKNLPRFLVCFAILNLGLSSALADIDRIWHIKALQPDGSFVDVKAVTSDGSILDVKALEQDGNLHFMDVKARHEGEFLNVKLLPATDAGMPLAAIMADGATLSVHALIKDGDPLPVMGVNQDGNIVHVKAVNPDGTHLPVKAISPSGQLMDVKGVVFDRTAGSVHGVAIAAHVKAIPQRALPAPADQFWNLRAIHPDGKSLPVVAATLGGDLPLQALETLGNPQIMDVKAIGSAQRLAVKVSAGEGSAVVAIGADGRGVPVEAIASDGTRLPVQATNRDGNIFHIKAVAADGTPYGVKAISAAGFLNDVKGLKVKADDVEGAEAGTDFGAHVKALPLVVGSN